MQLSRTGKIAIGISVVAFIGVVYYLMNPLDCKFAPKCPFWLLTGLKCPGCGSQRALHALLHGDILQAMRYNVLFLPSIIYVALIELLPRGNKFRDALTGTIACYIVLGIFIIFMIIAVAAGAINS